MACALEYHQAGSFAEPNFRLHKPELRSYAFLIHEQQVNLLLRYLIVDKNLSITNSSLLVLHFSTSYVCKLIMF